MPGKGPWSTILGELPLQPNGGSGYASLRVLLSDLSARGVDHPDQPGAPAGSHLSRLRPPRPGGAARDLLREDLAEELSGSRDWPRGAGQPERRRSASRISWETRSL